MEMIAKNDPLIRRIIHLTFWVLMVLVFGTVGYVFIEGWSTEDGLYMSVITLATVGYGETQELSGIGRLFTCLLIFVSIICLSCWTACLTSLFVEGDLTGSFKKRKAKRMSKSMTGHTIVCGSGIMAQTVLGILVRKGAKVVVVDSNSDMLDGIQRQFPGTPVIHSPAVDEIALASANVLNAKCIVAACDSDFDNMMISMTCKDLGTEIKVIARSDDSNVASRLIKIGVEKVICPYQLSGEQAAEFALG